MRLRMLAGGAMLGLLVALFAPMAALAQAETTTIHFGDTLIFPEDVDLCTGATGTTTQTFKGVAHLTELADGSFHVTITETDTFTFVPDDPSQPTYTARTTSRNGENLSSQNNFTATFTGHFVAKGSDGSREAGHGVGHVTLHPDGTVTVEFEKSRLTCP